MQTTISKRGGRRFEGLGGASAQWLRSRGTLIAVIIVPVIPVWWKFPGESTTPQLTVPGTWFQSTRSGPAGSRNAWFTKGQSSATSTTAPWWVTH